MLCSHHSHSGQFCKHGRDTLAQMVARAYETGFSVYCLTEHMPRDEAFLYPEELALGLSGNDLELLFEEYLLEARRLQQAYQGKVV